MQGADMFDAMIGEIRERTVRMILSVFPRERAVARVEVAKATSEGFEGQRQSGKTVRLSANSQTGNNVPRRAPVVKGKKIERNDPCPCGSGKKYKKCCGASASESAE